MSITLAKYIFHQYFDDNGSPLAGGKLYTYAAGTTDDKGTYEDAEGASSNTNPIILDSSGRCNMFLDSGAYKFVLKDSDDVTIKTIDNVYGQDITSKVDSIDDLKALTTENISIVQVLGYSTPNDGGGGLYYWDDTSTATADDGAVVLPDSSPVTGRWLLIHGKEINFRQYGCAVNGSTDDVAKAQLCDTYCNANDVSIVLDGTILFGSNPSILSNIIIKENGRIKWTASFQPTFLATVGNDLSQHFECPLAYTPVLDFNIIQPEWFGETIASRAKTSATIDDLTSDGLLVGTLNVEDNAVIGGSLTAASLVCIHASTHESGGTDLVDHDSLSGLVANEHIDHTSVSISGGNGLSGGGDISSNRTVSLAGYGSLTTNYTTKWNGSQLVNSQIFDNGTNVGIGTASPQCQFQIGSGPGVYNSEMISTTAAGDGCNLGLYDSQAVAADAGGGIAFGGVYSGTTLTEWAFVRGYKENATSGQYGGGLALGTRSHGTASATRMVITPSGNVGINNTSPSEKLEVTGSIKASGDIYTTAWTNYASTSTVVGWSSYTYKIVDYKVVGKLCFCSFAIGGTGSASTTVSFTLPYNNIVTAQYGAYGQSNDNSTLAVGLFTMAASSNVVTLYPTTLTSSWTASTSRTIRGRFWYEIA